jgi:protocatechuate 3,4-dioxygenase beta subunit
MPAGRGAPFGPNGPLQVASDANGLFAFEGLQPGRYRIDVQKAGFAMLGDPSERRMVDVIAGKPTARLELALKRGGVITGRVLGSNGEPISEAMVTAMRHGAGRAAHPMFGMVQAAQTNDVGEFRIAGLAEGAYVVIASPRPQFALGQPVNATSGGTTMAPTYYPATTSKDAAESISVAFAQTVSGIDITMISTPAYSVSGVVVDEAGAPLAGAMVTLMTDPQSGGPIAPAMGHADQNGTFRINGVISGSYRAMAAVPMIWNSQQGATGAGSAGAVAGGFVAGFNAAPLRAMEIPAMLDVLVDGADVNGVRIVLKSPPRPERR